MVTALTGESLLLYMIVRCQKSYLDHPPMNTLLKATILTDFDLCQEFLGARAVSAALGSTPA